MSLAPTTTRILIAVTTTVAAALAVLGRTWSGPPGADFALWILLCVLGEALWVRLPLGNATLSMAITANFAAMLLLPAGHALAAIAVATVIAEATLMRKSPLRFMFNASQSMLAAAAGIAVIDALGGVVVEPGSFGPAQTLACFAGATAYTLVNTLTVSLMIGLEHRMSVFAAWRKNFANPYEALSNGALFAMGVVLALLIRLIGPAAVVLVGLPVVLAWISYRHVLRTPAAFDEGGDDERDAA